MFLFPDSTCSMSNLWRPIRVIPNPLANVAIKESVVYGWQYWERINCVTTAEQKDFAVVAPGSNTNAHIPQAAPDS